jgi:hypothetical protein
MLRSHMSHEVMLDYGSAAVINEFDDDMVATFTGLAATLLEFPLITSSYEHLARHPDSDRFILATRS